MSLMMKLIVPLLDKKLVLDDLGEKSGFLNAYVYDKNRPRLQDQCFLLYNVEKKTTELNDREIRFRELTNLHSSKVTYIKNIPHIVYAFNVIGPDCRRILNGDRPTNIQNINRIIDFWQGKDSDINEFFFGTPRVKFKHVIESVPQYDYMKYVPTYMVV